MQKLYNKKVAPMCSYCVFGRPAPNGDSVLCEKRGIMTKDSSCRKFKYDPLKRIPKKEPEMQQSFSQEDFKL